MDICFPICSAARARLPWYRFRFAFGLVADFCWFWDRSKSHSKTRYSSSCKNLPSLRGGFPRQGKGGGKPPPGVSEERKKGRGKKGERDPGYEDRRGVLHARPGGSADYQPGRLTDSRITGVGDFETNTMF